MPLAEPESCRTFILEIQLKCSICCLQYWSQWNDCCFMLGFPIWFCLIDLRYASQFFGIFSGQKNCWRHVFRSWNYQADDSLKLGCLHECNIEECYTTCKHRFLVDSSKREYLKFLNEEVWGYVNANVSNGGGLRCFNCLYHEDFYWNFTRESCS